METVASADGTTIAYERTGGGPPLVLVHGTTADHTQWDGIRPAFEERHTVYALDRRGCGASGDADAYSLDREVEDVLAVVETIDEPVALLGHSYGALCSLEAARRIDDIRALVLYEAVFPTAGTELYPEDVLREMERELELGKNERVLELLLEDIAGLSSAEMDAVRSAPNWPSRVATAHAILRESYTEIEYDFDPARFADLDIPTLLLSGSESPPRIAEPTSVIHAALPNSRIAVLEGHGHVAMSTAPELFVEAVLSFLEEVR